MKYIESIVQYVKGIDEVGNDIGSQFYFYLPKYVELLQACFDFFSAETFVRFNSDEN